jgi:hypothetical protein
VIDAWLCCLPDAYGDDDLHVFELCTMPSLLVAKRSHPLFLLGGDLTIQHALHSLCFLCLPRHFRFFRIFFTAWVSRIVALY